MPPIRNWDKIRNGRSIKVWSNDISNRRVTLNKVKGPGFKPGTWILMIRGARSFGSFSKLSKKAVQWMRSHPRG